MLKLVLPTLGKSKRWVKTGGMSLSVVSFFIFFSSVFASNGERGTPMPFNGSSASTASAAGADERGALFPPRLKGAPDTEALTWYRVAVSGAKK